MSDLGQTPDQPTEESVSWREYLNRLSQLRETLDSRFDEEELRTLCFDLGVEYDDLPSRGRAGKARELVGYCARRDNLVELVRVAQKQRPDISWPIPPATNVASRLALSWHQSRWWHRN